MKNLLKILLILAFASPVFASSTAAPAFDATVTTDQIGSWPSDAQQAWVASLTADQYNMLNSDVQKWVMENTTADQQKALGINQ
ncbi:MAG TPA: DUF2673 domain-containing protein [Rickettsia endosymbiont of Pyrocoelia pectoralis]|nr:DUF2673 domain-containing protein [Rickettsia endosymbiont of Pyrocoelia pectoralis]